MRPCALIFISENDFEFDLLKEQTSLPPSAQLFINASPCETIADLEQLFSFDDCTTTRAHAATVREAIVAADLFLSKHPDGRVLIVAAGEETSCRAIMAGRGVPSLSEPLSAVADDLVEIVACMRASDSERTNSAADSPCRRLFESTAEEVDTEEEVVLRQLRALGYLD